MPFTSYGNAETNRHFSPLPSEAHAELEQGINLEVWSQGLLQPAYQISTGGAALQAWGSWTGLDEITLQPHDAVTIGIANASKDSRLRHYVVTILHHMVKCTAWGPSAQCFQAAKPWRGHGTMGSA